MNSALRLLIVIVVIGGLAALVSRRATGQETGQPPRGHQRLQAKAKAARHGDPQAVREFTDEIIDQLGRFGKTAESLRERLARCEVLFRQGAHEPVHEKHMERVFNETVDTVGAPRYWKINQSQIKNLRGNRRQLIPGFVEPRPEKGDGVPEAMGPAEAVYIMTLLAANKHSNPQFQVEPEEWDRRVKEKRLTHMKKKPELMVFAEGGILASGVPSTVSPEVALEVGLMSEDSETTAAAHRLLDRMGFKR